MRNLSGYERETIINFNEAEATAWVFTYSRSWQRHLEVKLGLRPVMDNGFGGKEYEIYKKRIRPPRAPVRLSAGARAKLTERLRHSPNLASQNAKPQAKSGAKKEDKGNTISHQLRTLK